MKNILNKLSDKKILITGANGYIGNQIKSVLNKNKMRPKKTSQFNTSLITIPNSFITSLT